VAGPTKKFTLFNVKNELEYRYYIEHIQGKRSVLQKVLQKDEVASAHMVLLIADIQKEGNKMVIQLSDGWYSVFSEVAIENSYKIEKNHMTNNQLLSYLINTRKLYPGLKIHVANMRAIKAAGKVDPNKEISLDERTLVELAYNSISRARWDEKLGVAKSQYFSKSLKSLRNNGGVVSMIDVIVLKKYKKIEKSWNTVK
jgi:breast cancer 2 susceptibility protein